MNSDCPVRSTRSVKSFAWLGEPSEGEEVAPDEHGSAWDDDGDSDEVYATTSQSRGRHRHGSRQTLARSRSSRSNRWRRPADANDRRRHRRCPAGKILSGKVREWFSRLL
jgi:hypothetical protein